MDHAPHSPEKETENENDNDNVLHHHLHHLLAESDNEEETLEFCFQEEMVEEVMQEFYKEIAMFPACHVSPNLPIFINDANNNGNCGPSLSGSASTLMAGIDGVSSTAGGFPVPENGSAVVEKEGERDTLLEGFDLDDEWVGRMLSWGQLVECRNQWL